MKYQVITPSGDKDQPIEARNNRYAFHCATDTGFEVIAVDLISELLGINAVLVTEESYDSVQERRAGAFR